MTYWPKLLGWVCQFALADHLDRVLDSVALDQSLSRWRWGCGVSEADC